MDQVINADNCVGGRTVRDKATSAIKRLTKEYKKRERQAESVFIEMMVQVLIKESAEFLESRRIYWGTVPKGLKIGTERDTFYAQSAITGRSILLRVKGRPTRPDSPGIAKVKACAWKSDKIWYQKLWNNMDFGLFDSWLEWVYLDNG